MLKSGSFYFAENRNFLFGIDMSKIAKYFFVLFITIIVFSSFGIIKKSVDQDSDTNNPLFWINALSDPDKIILNPQQIKNLNTFVIEKGLNNDLYQVSKIFNKNGLKGYLTKNIDYYFKHSDEFSYNKNFVNKINGIKTSMDISKIGSEINPDLGIITNKSDLRFLPTMENIYQGNRKYSYDLLQIDTLDIGSIVLFLHKSQNSDWFFVQTRLASGWIESKNIALDRQQLIKSALDYDTDKFIIVIEPQAKLYSDINLIQITDTVFMGSKFAIKDFSDSAIEINFPVRRDDGTLEMQNRFIKRERVSISYLPYTKRNIILQAFKFLNTNFAWGKKTVEFDCSGFIHTVFSTMGIYLPRNSSAQSEIGEIIGKYNPQGNSNKLDILKSEAVPGITLFNLPNHLVLYLGFYRNKPYVIHSLWGYKKKVLFWEIDNIVNKIVVTDLYLEKHTNKGSFLNQVDNINIIR